MVAPNTTTLKDKVMCGYQGWFNAEGDGMNVGWRHWFQANSTDPCVDIWPDTAGFGADELFPSPLRLQDGSQAMLYSSCNDKTVDRHFQWMQEYGIDGVFLQRFINELQVPALLQVRTKVTSCVRASAERHGRVFCIMYDISGAPVESVLQRIRDDWAMLSSESTGVTSSDSYLRHEGKPVLAIWGFGFSDRPDPGPAAVMELINELRRTAFLVGGAPAQWRTGEGDSKAGYGGVYRAFDCISPWSIGRFFDLGGCDEYYERRAKEDACECAAECKGFAPVIWPGFSEANLQSRADGRNVVPRYGGLFLWQQARQALTLDHLFIYVAMFDECDEGTAIYKAAATASAVPSAAPGTFPMITMDEDGICLPSDWYLRIVGAITKLAANPSERAKALEALLPVEVDEETERAMKRVKREQEGARTAANRAVRDVYREVLMREGDPGGVAFYTQKVVDGHAVEEVRQWMLDSPERASLEARLQQQRITPQPPPPSSLPQILPRPLASSTPDAARPFVVASSCTLLLQMDADEADQRRDLMSFFEVAKRVADFLGLAPPEIVQGGRGGGGSSPSWTISLNAGLAEEEYDVSVSAGGVTVAAATAIGALWAFQSLRQLLPVEVEKGREAVEELKRTGQLCIPACRIQDKPKFAWRGSMLDCARHFMPMDLVRRHIQALSVIKVNVLHLHLTEDQGWRVMVDAFPELEKGAWRTGAGGAPEGGIYSKADLRELVEYARQWGITVVPEIELPGHCNAALAVYPHLSCREAQFTVQARWGVYEDVYCLGKDSTLEFLETVLGEMLDIFPSKYMHIGGDEVPFTRWRSCQHCQQRIRSEGLDGEAALQSWGIRRIGQFLAGRGRVLVGWDEVLQGALPHDAIVQAWRGAPGAVVAARQGHRVINSPTDHCYLDYEISVTDLRQSYEFSPVPPEVPSDLQHLVIGGEFNMWTEYAPDSVVESKIWPRGLAIAEVLWSGPGGDFHRFFTHLRASQLPRLVALGIRPGPAFPPGWTEDGSPPQPSQIALSVPGATLSSSLPHYKHHHKEFVLDGHPDTFFWSCRPARSGDVMAVHFERPVTDCTLVQVKTGRFDQDWLRHGAVEFLLQGETAFRVSATLVSGSAMVPVGPGVSLVAVRVRVTADQAEWLIIRELAVETLQHKLSRYHGPLAVLRGGAAVGGEAWTTFRTYLAHGVQHAVDADDATVCWSDRCVAAGDALTVMLDTPTAVAAVEVVTGAGGAGEGGGADLLRSGVVETSSDGEQWVEQAVFVDGLASGSVGGLEVRGVRVRVTGRQDEWLKVRRVTLLTA